LIILEKSDYNYINENKVLGPIDDKGKPSVRMGRRAMGLLIKDRQVAEFMAKLCHKPFC